MQIRLLQTGGWANMAMGCTVADTALSPDQRRWVEDLLAQARPSRAILRRVAMPAAPTPDGLHYELEVSDHGPTRTLCYAQGAPPDSLVRLLESLRPLFRPLPRGGPHQPLG
jgi:hypothetical protein